MMLIQAVLGAAAVAANSAGHPQLEQFAVDRGGHMRAIGGMPDLRHEDGDVVALVVRAAVIPGPRPVGLPVELLPTGMGDEGDTPTEVTFTPDGAKIELTPKNATELETLRGEVRQQVAAMQVALCPDEVSLN